MLARHGVDPDHDQIYLRFLLRLGGKRETGETLYQSFESLLAELGIQIEINPEENEIQDVTRSLNATVENSPELQTRSEAGSDTGIRSRRASFHSLADQKGEGTEGSRRRSSSRASVAGSQRNQVAQVRDRPSTRATTRRSERFDRRALSSQHAAQPARGRLTAREFATNLQHYQRHASASTTRTNIPRDRNNLARHSRTQSVQGPLIQPQQDLLSPGYDFSAITNENEQGRRALDYQNHYTQQHQEAYRPDVRELFYRPTETQLLRDADTFQHFRIRALMRNVIGRWHTIGLEMKRRHERMISKAQNHDHGILLRQSFDQWRAQLHLNIETAAAEQYFVHVEEKAEKARDLYLLAKAFTHWQQIILERVEYAMEARRRVLRVKYFHAWLTHTLENGQKVRLHGERKFFTLWNQRHLTSLGNEHKASFARARNLIRTGYWKWFWTFCERRAPQWKDRRLQSFFFNRWALSSQQKAWREYEVAVARHQRVKQKWFSRWLQQARIVLSNTKKAESIYQQRITAYSMMECRRQIRYAPFTRQVSNMADWRIAGSTFAIFVNRFRTGQQAHRVKQLRTMRNVWTAWNDRLRWQTLESQIDDRVLIQALYRWVLAERCLLLRRLCEQRIKRLVLRKVVQFHRTRAATQKAVCKDIEGKRQVRTAKLIMDRWRYALDICDQNAQIAFEFEAPRVAQQTMIALSSKMNHIRKLDQWAVDASYYFYVVRYLKQWRAATVESHRRKLHEAYARIRRQTKMKLARSSLHTWRDRSQQTQELQKQADSHNQTHLLRFGTSLFDQWRNRLFFLIDREDEANLEFDRRFSHKHLDIWVSRHHTQTQLYMRAGVNAELHISYIASKCLHKLRLRTIEFKGPESKAESLRQWYVKRHSHDLLRQWREKTAKTRGQPSPLPPPVFPSAKARRLATRADAEARQDDAAGRVEEWTAFDEGGFDAGEWIPGMENVEASSTPLPGYLSTPSKRAARARGLARISTTPAGTPFAARLRSQLGRTPSRRGEFAASGRVFAGSAFGAIPESEPRTPGG